MASMASPKAIGQKIGTVTACNAKFITARLDAPLANGDGLGFLPLQELLPASG